MNYELLDALILDCLMPGSRFLVRIMSGEVHVECDRIADATWRESYRVLDARLQALRKAGKIAFTSKAGWAVV